MNTEYNREKQLSDSGIEEISSLPFIRLINVSSSACRVFIICSSAMLSAIESFDKRLHKHIKLIASTRRCGVYDSIPCPTSNGWKKRTNRQNATIDSQLLPTIHINYTQFNDCRGSECLFCALFYSQHAYISGASANHNRTVSFNIFFEQ